MRVENWKAKEIFSQIAEEALKAANEVMDDVVAASKAKCPVGTITREGKFVKANVAFYTAKGAKKGGIGVRFVSFATDKQWAGRTPGDLRNSVRKVSKPARPGNIRCYAGNFKIYYAHMVEYGTMKSRRQSFMRPAFNAIKNTVLSRIEKGIKNVPEVKS